MPEIKARRLIIYVENSIMEVAERHCGPRGATVSAYVRELMVRDLARRDLLDRDLLIEMLASPSGLVTTK